MRGALALLLLLSLTLAGCSDDGGGSEATTTDSEGDEMPPEESPAIPADLDNESKISRDFQGQAGDWIVLLQEFGTGVTDFSTQYDYDLTTDADAYVLVVNNIPNHGDYGLSTDRSIRRGSPGGGGSLTSAGGTPVGLAFAYASDKPWTLDWSSDPTAAVTRLHVLRGSGAVFGEAPGAPDPTPASRHAVVDLPVTSDSWVHVDPYTGEWVPGTTFEPLATATVTADVAGKACSQERVGIGTTGDSIAGLGAWSLDGTVHVELDVPVTATDASLRYVTIPLGGQQMPPRWELGAYCGRIA